LCRPFDVDEAVLRRLPRTFEFPLPCGSERRDILRVLLNEHPIEQKLIQYLAAHTKGYSGSDLQELCKYLIFLPVREQLRTNTNLTPQSSSTMRSLTMEDVILSLQQVKKSGETATQYQQTYRPNSRKVESENEQDEHSDVSVD
jgi:SpoVK/Ycf46/Vps4 family AAA+-type ATPase